MMPPGAHRGTNSAGTYLQGCSQTFAVCKVKSGKEILEACVPENVKIYKLLNAIFSIFHEESHSRKFLDTIGGDITELKILH